MVLTWLRIVDNAHLLDATEIFRKLNVHKKVSRICSCPLGHRSLTQCAGIIYQAWFPSRPVLLLPIQHDCRSYQGRSALKPLLWLDNSSTPGLHATRIDEPLFQRIDK